MSPPQPAVEVVAVSSPVVTTKTVTVSKTVSVKKTTIKIVPELPSCSGASVAVAIMHGGNVLHDWSYITGPTTFSGVPVEGCTLKYKPVCGSKNCCGAEKTVSVTVSGCGGWQSQRLAGAPSPRLLTCPRFACATEERHAVQELQRHHDEQRLRDRQRERHERLRDDRHRWYWRRHHWCWLRYDRH